MICTTNISLLEKMMLTDVSTYESADLIALENARIALVDEIMTKYVDPMLDRVFTEYYSTKKDDPVTKKKK